MTPEENNQEPERPRIQLVCVGKTYVEKDKIGLLFKVINGDGPAGPERIYLRKDLEHVRVGAIYEVETNPEKPTSIYLNTFRWLRLWEDATEAAAWQASADAFDTRDVALRQERKENGRKLPLELLEPIRREHRKTNAAGRLALEVRVLAYLRQVKITGELI